MATEKFLVIDTETTNSLDDPLCYDVGFAVVDASGKVYEARSYVVADIFLDKELMQFAYFADKIPQYWDDIKSGKRELRRFRTIRSILCDVCATWGIKRIYAHNARFDYRSLNTTQRFITGSKYRFFLPFGTEVCDTLKMARHALSENEAYTHFCEENDFTTLNGKPQFTAEVIYRFLTNDIDFEESHTGLEDVEIEKEILAYCLATCPEFLGHLWD